MVFIDKSKPEFKREAHRIIQTFIDGQWQEDANQYVNLTYESFNTNELKNLLLEEQGQYCCYCMKLISDRETTLEHIIPNNAPDPATYTDYVQYGEIETSVFFWCDNMRFTKINTPPFPHIIAYENLVASCNGYIPSEGKSRCCNNMRGSERIIPLFYLPNVTDEIKYDDSGMILCETKYNETIRILGLENHTLQLFRRCWLNLPAQYDVEDINEASDDENLRTQIVDDMDPLKIHISDRSTLLNPTYWDSFKSYCWFYRYKQ